ncbi:hypothetical protein PISMIDRAFT_114302 [Pisolithus microcarpus 441]|uniref:WH1 domain-containing protein n=1 Tax=Pisolithus microcarpus 441 TaxID=765257 RepID=A0A0C9Z0W7_9AGAM|nr:hypothetical protein PISMIDRAFT_114302 [Pisolithus microcarpus 441]
MAPKSALFEGEKTTVKSAISSEGSKILFATPARIYFAHPRKDKWTYGGLQGALALVEDLSKSAHFVKLVDIFGSGGVIWSHEIYEGFELNQDKSFFYSFAGDSCMIGLVFSDEKDAKTLHKKLTSRKATKGSVKTSNTVSKGGKIDKSMISGPVGGSFKHVAHMEFDMEKGFITEGVDQSWGQLAAELHKDYGIPKALVEANTDFIRGFFETAKRNGRIEATQEPPKKKPPPPPVPRRGTHGPSASVTSTNGDAEPTAATPASPARPGRADLLASIRGQSVHNLRKTPKVDSNATSTPTPAPDETSTRGSDGGATTTAGGGDLTAALAAALLQRNKKLGDSDDEDEDDDDDWD